MYREADGADDVRRAVREQLRRGADFVKVMTTGARSVELEDPNPAQMTREEIATIVDEAHRMGYRVAAHAEGLDGTEIAIETGIDTIEHGMYLNRRPDLLERMAAVGPGARPDARLLLRRRGRGRPDGAGPDGAPAPRRRAAADVVAPARRPRAAQPRAGRPDPARGQRRRRRDRHRPRLGADHDLGTRDRPHGPPRPVARRRRSSRRPRRPRARSASATTSGRSSRAGSPTSSSSTATRSSGSASCATASGSGSCCQLGEPVAGAALERQPAGEPALSATS